MNGYRLEALYGGPLRIWELPQPGKAYTLGTDPASGKTQLDWSYGIICEALHGSICASWRAHAEPSTFAEAMYVLGGFYGQYMDCRQAFLVPEINNHGLAFLDKARELGYFNIYSRQSWDRVGQEWQPALGFQTTIKSKAILIRRGREALSDPDCRIRDPIVLDEMSTFIRNEAGKEEAMEGRHDDGVIAFCLAQEGVHMLQDQGVQSSPDPVAPAKRAAQEREDRHRWVWTAMEAAAEESARRYVRMVP